MRKILFLLILLNLYITYAACGCAKVNINNPSYQQEVEEELEAQPVRVEVVKESSASPITGAAVTELNKENDDNNLKYLATILLILFIINIIVHFYRKH